MLMSFFLFNQILFGEMNTLTVIVEGIRTEEGHINGLLFDSPEGFPDSIDDSARIISHISIENGKSVFILDNLAPGEYALAVIHDENGNDRFDTGFWGIPREGFAVSNNPEAPRSAPRYSDAVFSYEGGDITLVIQMHYF